MSGTESKPDETVKSDTAVAVKPVVTEKPAEIGGRGGLDPTRYGDWEKNGRCVDF